MIEIKRITDNDLAKKLCDQNGLAWSEDYKVIATLDGETTLNLAIFTYGGEVGEIYRIAGFEDDLFMLDGLCRAILNIMDIGGVKQVYLPKIYDKLAKLIGFQDGGEKYVLQLEGFFQCKCGKKSEG